MNLLCKLFLSSCLCCLFAIKAQTQDGQSRAGLRHHPPQDGKYIPIPPDKVERNRDNPDGRNHLCAPPPNVLHPSNTVFCFALGGAT